MKTIDAGIGTITYETDNLQLCELMETIEMRISEVGAAMLLDAMQKGFKNVLLSSKELTKEIEELKKENDELKEEIEVQENTIEDMFEPSLIINTGNGIIYMTVDNGNLSDVQKCEDFARSVSIPNCEPTLF